MTNKPDAEGDASIGNDEDSIGATGATTADAGTHIPSRASSAAKGDDLIAAQYKAIGQVNIPTREKMGLDAKPPARDDDLCPNCGRGICVGCPPETSGAMLQRLGIDGMLWAKEMQLRFPTLAVDDILGWCCNMIMAGWDEATRRLQHDIHAYEGATPENEQFPHCYIGRLTFAQWKEFAKRDDCLMGIIPSDLRQILGFAEKMQNNAVYWREQVTEDKRESNALRSQVMDALDVVRKLRKALDVHDTLGLYYDCHGGNYNHRRGRTEQALILADNFIKQAGPR